MTRLHRLEVALEVGAEVVIEGAVAHHLVHVLRVAPGHRMRVVDASASVFEVEVVAVSPLTVAARSVAAAPGADPDTAVELWIPLLKGGRTDDLIRQLTELGVSRLVPFTSEHSVVRLEGRRAEERRRRWEAIARSACGQCGRTEAPVVAAVRGLPEEGPGVVFDERPGPRPAEVLRGEAARRLLVGPEGGLSPRELERLAALGWRRAWLGPRVLRAETAAVAAAVLALYVER